MNESAVSDPVGTERTIAVLSDLTAPHPRDLARLRERFERTAVREDLVDVAYTHVDSPIGSLLLAATKVGLVRVAFALEDHDQVLQSLATSLSPRIVQVRQRLDAVVREFDEYFDGRRRHFDVALDHVLSHGFRLLVQRQLTEIAYGDTASYAAVATTVGRPRAVRAVGSACATNPLPIVVPCHRVLRSDGTLGGYRGGLDAKRVLLALESRA